MIFFKKIPRLQQAGRPHHAGAIFFLASRANSLAMAAEGDASRYFHNSPDKIALHLTQWVAHKSKKIQSSVVLRRPIFCMDWAPGGTKFATAGAGESHRTLI
jgi:hypothetical protein